MNVAAFADHDPVQYEAMLEDADQAFGLLILKLVRQGRALDLSVWSTRGIDGLAVQLVGFLDGAR